MVNVPKYIRTAKKRIRTVKSVYARLKVYTRAKKCIRTVETVFCNDSMFKIKTVCAQDQVCIK